MKIKKIIFGIFSNWLIILGTVFLVTKVLDWYNPLMNFSGQSEIIQILLGICAVLSGIFNIFAWKK